MLLNSLGRRRIWGLENYNIKAYRACHVDEQPYSLTGPGDPWKGESHDLWWHGGGQGQALCQTQAVRQVKPHPRPRPPLVLACTRREPNFTPDSYIATSSPGIHQKVGSGIWMAAAVHKGQSMMAGGGNMVGRKGPASSWHGVGSVKARRKTRDRAGSQFRQDRVIDRARQEGAQHWYARALLSTDYMSYERQSTSKVASRLHWRHFMPFFCEHMYQSTFKDVNSLQTLQWIGCFFP